MVGGSLTMDTSKNKPLCMAFYPQTNFITVSVQTRNNWHIAFTSLFLALPEMVVGVINFQIFGSHSLSICSHLVK